MMDADVIRRVTWCPKCCNQRLGKESSELLKPTLREFAAVGMLEDNLNITYRCRCPECGWEWKYDNEVDPNEYTQ